MLEYARIRIGDGALPTCGLCDSVVPETHLPADEIALSLGMAIDQATDAQPLNVILVGSEPFRHPALPAIIAECTRVGAARIAVETDAGAFNIEENAHGALLAGLRQIHVPLFGPDAATHARLRNGAGFAQSCAGASSFLRAAQRAGLPALLLGVLPVCSHNIDHAAATVAVFARLGAVAVRIVPDAVSDQDPRLRAACETGMANGVWVWVESGDTSPSLEAHTQAPFAAAVVTL